MNELRKVSSNPHIRMHISTQMIMLCVIIALLPTTIFGIWNFGLHALVLILVTIASTVLGEWIFAVFGSARVAFSVVWNHRKRDSEEPFGHS